MNDLTDSRYSFFMSGFLSCEWSELSGFTSPHPFSRIHHFPRFYIEPTNHSSGSCFFVPVATGSHFTGVEERAVSLGLLPKSSCSISRATNGPCIQSPLAYITLGVDSTLSPLRTLHKSPYRASLSKTNPKTSFAKHQRQYGNPTRCPI